MGFLLFFFFLLPTLFFIVISCNEIYTTCFSNSMFNLERILLISLVWVKTKVQTCFQKSKTTEGKVIVVWDTKPNFSNSANLFRTLGLVTSSVRLLTCHSVTDSNSLTHLTLSTVLWYLPILLEGEVPLRCCCFFLKLSLYNLLNGQDTY